MALIYNLCSYFYIYLNYKHIRVKTAENQSKNYLWINMAIQYVPQMFIKDKDINEHTSEILYEQ